jgi:hypothetical protein
VTFFEPPSGDHWALPRRPRRSGRLGNTVTVVVTALATIAALIVMLMVTTPGGSPFAGLGIGDEPDAGIVALADRMHLTEEGRKVFYDTRPEIVDQAKVEEFCHTSDHADGLTTDGCYGGYDRILIARPDNGGPSAMVTTAAHELLHAAYSRMSNFDQMAAADLADAAMEHIPSDDIVHLQVASSVGDNPESRGTELFAYLGTQFADLDPELEAYYSRYIADRRALVDEWKAFSAGLVLTG